MNPGDAEAEKNSKRLLRHMQYLVMLRNGANMTSLDTRHLKMAVEEPADLAAFDFNGADFGDIFGDIFGDLFGGGRRGGRAGNGPMKGMNIRKGVRITFEEAIRGCEKELDLVIKDPCPKCNGTGAKPEPVRRLVPNVAEKVR